jgi:hypothetical protein
MVQCIYSNKKLLSFILIELEYTFIMHYGLHLSSFYNHLFVLKENI